MNIDDVSHAQALERLIEGNRRFVGGIRSVEPMLAHSKMAQLASDGQKPFAIVLTCSDSRSPVELIFDQGVGDLFVVRVAGNVIAPSLLASIEFAAANFGSSLVLVLGHTKCGAIDATLQHMKSPGTPLPSPHLEELVGRIRPAIEALPASTENLLAAGTIANVRRSTRLIHSQSEIIRSLVAAGKVKVIGGILDLATGAVEFLD